MDFHVQGGEPTPAIVEVRSWPATDVRCDLLEGPAKARRAHVLAASHVHVLERDVREQRVARVRRAHPADAHGLSARERASRRRIDHDEGRIGQRRRRKTIEHGHRVCRRSFVVGRREDVDLKVGAQAQRLFEETVSGGDEQDPKCPRRAGDRRHAVIQREVVLGVDAGGDRGGGIGHGKDEVLCLARLQAQRTQVDQARVRSPLERERARLLSEVVHP